MEEMSGMMTKTWEQFEKLQPAVMRLLKQALLKKRVAHSYLFEGMKGTGKTETGFLLAKSLYCERPVDGYKPCEECIECKRINHRNHPDIHIIEPDGTSIKKEQIHQLQLEFSKKAVESGRKFYMIIDADKMTNNAANSLLKFLEEPGQATTAVLITENVQKILPTIYSRCQHLAFKPFPKNELIQLLIERNIKPDRAPLIANITNNIDVAIELAADQWFLQARKLVIQLYEGLVNQPINDILYFCIMIGFLIFKKGTT